MTEIIQSQRSLANAGFTDVEMRGCSRRGLQYTGPPVVRILCTMLCFGG